VWPCARSNYVTRAEALSLGLAISDGDSFILRADDTTTLSPGGKGRNSFRIISNHRYGAPHVSVWVVHLAFAFLLRREVFMIGVCVATQFRHATHAAGLWVSSV
jgi:hypothetical protein